MRRAAVSALLALVLAAANEIDEMWLRQPRIADDTLLQQARAQFHSIIVTAEPRDGKTSHQLKTVAEELSHGLSSLLDRETLSTCCDAAPDAEHPAGTLVVTVEAGVFAHLGTEGFAITTSPAPNGRVYRLNAAAPSGALYGTFRLLSYLQRGMMVPEIESIPAMELRIWDLWDGTHE